VPTRLRDLIRVFAEYGITVEKPRGGGSRWKAVRRSDGKMYPIPAGNAEKTEIGNQYIRAACDTFEIDRDELKKKL
jgi:hypothetical protein